MPSINSPAAINQASVFEISRSPQHSTANSTGPLLEQSGISIEPWYAPFSSPSLQFASPFQRIQDIVATPRLICIDDTQQWLRDPNRRLALLPGICAMALMGGTLGFAWASHQAEHAGHNSPAFSSAFICTSIGAVIAPASFVVLAVGMRAMLTFSLALNAEIGNCSRTRQRFADHIADHWYDLPASEAPTSSDAECPITLTPLYHENENQRLQEPTTIVHQPGVFEYRDLLAWFVKNPVNPLSRSTISPADFRKIVRLEGSHFNFDSLESMV